MGLSGSFLCDTNGTHVFSVDAQDSTIWQFVSDDFVSVDSFGSDSFELAMTSGYRYGFRFLTTIAGEGSLTVTVDLPNGSRTSLAQFSETCEVNGCVNVNATREESCVVVPARPNTAAPSADVTNREGAPGDSQEGSSTNIGMIVGIVFAVVAVIAILIIVVIVWRKNQEKAKVEDGDEEAKGEESEHEDVKPGDSTEEVVEQKAELLEPENPGEPVPEGNEAEPEKAPEELENKPGDVEDEAHSWTHQPEITYWDEQKDRPPEPEMRRLPEELHTEMIPEVSVVPKDELGEPIEMWDDAMAGSAGNVPEPDDVFENLCTILRINRRR
jgi:hypothetical protein